MTICFYASELGVWPTNLPDKIVRAEERKFVVLPMPSISYLEGPTSSRINWQRNEQTILSGDLNTYIALDHSLAILNIPLSFDDNRFRVTLLHNPLTTGQRTQSNNFVLDVTGEF